MRKLLFVCLLAFVAQPARADCGTFTDCTSCTTASSMYGATTCRWCSKDTGEECHEYGSWYNSCSDKETVYKPAQCPNHAQYPTSTFDFDTFRDMVAFSNSTYEDEPCNSDSMPANFRECHTLRFESQFSPVPLVAFYGVQTWPQRVVIAFRGTESDNIEELLSELDYIEGTAIPGLPEDVKASTFFVDGAMGLMEQLGSDYTVLQNIISRYPNAPLFITGHSLGGAMASIVALHMAYTNAVRETPTLYTFGQPRTGNSAFAHKVNQNIPYSFRVVNGDDIVPHLPPCEHLKSTCPNFHHGLEIWFPNGDMCQYEECTGDPYGEDPECADSLSLLSLAAHSGYFDVLKPNYSCE